MTNIEVLSIYAIGALIASVIFAFVLAFYGEMDDGYGAVGFGGLWPFTVPVFLFFLILSAFVKFISFPQKMGAQARKKWRGK